MAAGYSTDPHNEEVQKLGNELFVLLDPDGSGGLSKAELDAGLKAFKSKLPSKGQIFTNASFEGHGFLTKKKTSRLNRAQFLQVIEKESRSWRDPLKFTGALKAHILLLQVHQSSGGVDLDKCPSSVELAREVFGLMDMNRDGTASHREIARFRRDLVHWAGFEAHESSFDFQQKGQAETELSDEVSREGAPQGTTWEDFLEALQAPFQKLGQKGFDNALNDHLAAWRTSQQRRLKVWNDLKTAQALCIDLENGIRQHFVPAYGQPSPKSSKRPTGDWGKLVLLLFDIIDGDNSGFVEPQEFRRVCEMISECSASYAVEDMCFDGRLLSEGSFSILDKNNDSKIDQKEFWTYMNQAKDAFGPRQVMMSVRLLLEKFLTGVDDRDEASEHLSALLEAEYMSGTCSSELQRLTEAALQAREDHAHMYETRFSLVARCHSLGLHGDLWRYSLEAMRSCEPPSVEHITLEVKYCSRRTRLPAKENPGAAVLERLAGELEGVSIDIREKTIEVIGASVGHLAHELFLTSRPKPKVPDGSYVLTEAKPDGPGLRVTLEAKIKEPGLRVIKETCHVHKSSSNMHVIGCSEVLDVKLPHRSLAVKGRLSEAAVHLLWSEDGSGPAPVSLLDELGERLEKEGSCRVAVFSVPYWMQALMRSAWGGECLDLAAGRQCFTHDLERRGRELNFSETHGSFSNTFSVEQCRSSGGMNDPRDVNEMSCCSSLRYAFELCGRVDVVDAHDRQGLACLESRLELILKRLDQKGGAPSATAVRRALSFKDADSGLACLRKILKMMPSAGDPKDVMVALRSKWPYKQKRAALEALRAHGWCFCQGSIVEAIQTYSYDAVTLLLEVGVGESSYAALKRAGFDELSGRDRLTSHWGAAAHGSTDEVCTLLAKGMHPDVRDGRGLSALHHAAMNNHVEVVRLLLKSKADVHVRDNMQRTPLHYATPAAAKELVHWGGSPAALDCNGETPLVAARRKAVLCGGVLPMPGVPWSEVEVAVALKTIQDRVERLIILGFGSSDAAIFEGCKPAANDKLQLRNHLLGPDANERGTLLCQQLLIPLLELAGIQKLAGQLRKFCCYLLLHCVLSFAPVQAVSAAERANGELAKVLDMEYAKDENRCLRTLSSAPTELVGPGKSWNVMHQREATGEPAWLATSSDLEGVIDLFHLGAFRTVEDLCDWGNAGSWSEERQYVRYLRQLAQIANDSLQKNAREIVGAGHIAGPVKGDSRMIAKQEDYLEATCKEYGAKAKSQRAGGIVDVVRFSVSCASAQEMAAVYKRLMSCKLKRDSLEVVRVKNGFHEEARAMMGYRDIKLNFITPVPGREDCCVIGECQLLLESFLRIKEFQHILYEVIRGDCLDERARIGILIYQALQGQDSTALLDAVSEAYASLRSAREEELATEVLERYKEAAEAEWAESKRALAHLAEEHQETVLKQLDNDAEVAKDFAKRYDGTGPSFDLWLDIIKEEVLSKVHEAIPKSKPQQKRLNSQSTLEALDKAGKVLRTIKPGDVTELRSMFSPPELVLGTLSAVALLLGQANHDSWKGVQKMLADRQFLTKLSNFDPTSVKGDTLQKLKKYTSLEDFKPEIVGKKSRPCKGVCMWVLAVKSFAEGRLSSRLLQ